MVFAESLWSVFGELSSLHSRFVESFPQTLQFFLESGKALQKCRESKNVCSLMKKIDIVLCADLKKSWTLKRLFIFFYFFVLF